MPIGAARAAITRQAAATGPQVFGSYGFGAHGTDETDHILIDALQTIPAQMTVSYWAKLNSGTPSRAWRFATVDEDGNVFFALDTSSRYSLVRRYDDASRLWRRGSDAIARDQWIHAFIHWDASEPDATKYRIWIDDVELSHSAIENPTGSPNAANQWIIGNGDDVSPVTAPDAKIADFAMWDALLSAQDRTDLAGGLRADNFPTNQIFHFILDGSDTGLTVSGAVLDSNDGPTLTPP